MYVCNEQAPLDLASFVEQLVTRTGARLTFQMFVMGMGNEVVREPPSMHSSLGAISTYCADSHAHHIFPRGMAPQDVREKVYQSIPYKW